ncbi:hypothetical protein PT974_07696 [Cladobotryum mycophilum]|uniref:Uncharacterized protein n=1 Tax=Cladobotryum mycophilum TaxID=491253 RepID=A0ABR0SHM5_9HYPO
MSIISGKPDKVQLLIPTDLLNDRGGSMGITAQCFSNVDQLPTKDTVSYDDWKENIKGNRVEF